MHRIITRTENAAAGGSGNWIKNAPNCAPVSDSVSFLIVTNPNQMLEFNTLEQQ